MAEVTALSPSSMSTWSQCPKRWYFERVLELGTAPGKEAACGSFVHLVLEHLMGLPGPERTPANAQALAAALWPDFSTDEGFIDLGLDEEGVALLKRNAWTGVLGYFEIEDPQAVQVVGRELHVEAVLDGAPVHGFIDRLDDCNGTYAITDYKNGKAPEWDNERHEKLDQLRFYAAVLDACGEPVGEVRLLYLSPQVAAAARAGRALQAEAAVLAHIATLVPGLGPDVVLNTLDAIETARKDARRGRGRGEAARRAGEDAMWFAAEQALVGTDEPMDLPVVIGALVVAANARRKAFYAAKTARNVKPCTISLEVTEDDLAWARAHAASIWAEVRQATATGEFPARPGVLCDWCSFAALCTGFQAWDSAGRPSLSA